MAARPQAAHSAIAADESFVVLGVDPGLTVTGWGLVAGEAGSLRSLGCGTVATKPTLPQEQRLHRIFQELCDVIERARPAEVAVEDPFVGENVRSAFAVGQARAVCLLAAAQAGLPVRPYAPAEVKLAVTGYGRSDKTQVQEMVRVQLGLAEPPRPADAADALAIALCHHLRRHIDKRLERAQ